MKKESTLLKDKLICPKLDAKYKKEARNLGLSGKACEKYVKAYQNTREYQLNKISDSLIKNVWAFRDSWNHFRSFF